MGAEKKRNVGFKVRTMVQGEVDVTGSIYSFPALKECRERLADVVKQEITWPEGDDWEGAHASGDVDDDAPF